ncbi:MAG: Glycosyltransferases involved in cell wall biogenesis [Candidatus Carbobacillus altaicus]|uniref:Glucosyl-3-phosphoglycerate synthase n=1 Tax=Candidatus Carbonibacillus altaicus TaxID=2163959 RepID=A0A2R6Y3C5_9BACL|nr:MAG: Glycosyltransferases involved in cell wall biogenesis [Candidatus Carbobacillus altaicus]
MKTSIIIPSYNMAESLKATVDALLENPFFDEIVIVDDGSRDRTSSLDWPKGVRTVRLARNHGKGYALSQGIVAASHERLILTDADLAGEAPKLRRFLDMSADVLPYIIGVLPRSEQGGLGLVERWSRQAIYERTGLKLKAPLSGQRLILRRWLLPYTRSFPVGWGIEVYLTLLLARLRLYPLEVDLPIRHVGRGRNFSGFLHRGRQGLDIMRVLARWDAEYKMRGRHAK